jgi:hypothetical protein
MSYFAGLGIEGDVTDGKGFPQIPFRTPQQGADAGHQLFPVYGFLDVVVGPGVESLDPVVDAVPGAQDQHRRGHLAGPPGLEQGHAVAVGKAEIQDHGVVIDGRRRRVRFVEGGAGIDGKPFDFHAGFHVFGKLGMVFD